MGNLPVDNGGFRLANTVDTTDSLEFASGVQNGFHEKDMSSFDKIETIGTRLDWNE